MTKDIWPIARFSHGCNLMADSGIKKAIETGVIKIKNGFTSDQLQPSTLDVRIGKVRVYDYTAMMRTASDYNRNVIKNIDYEPISIYANFFPDEKDIPIDIPPFATAEIFFHEQLEYDSSLLDVTCDLRSSRGRLGLKPNSDRLEHDCDGFYLSMTNFNPNTIRLYGQDKFAQLFFHPRNEDLKEGYIVVESPEEAYGIAKTLMGCEPHMHGLHVVFSVGDHVLQFKRIGMIDTKKKYSDDELYIKHSTNEDVENPLVKIRPLEAVISQLSPRLKMPKDVGIKLLHVIPYVQVANEINSMWPNEKCIFLEPSVVNAGWVDPGYEGNVTAHPMNYKNTLRLVKGMPLAFGLIYKYETQVERAYGSKELNSHYQGSDGVGSRS